jgi:hypothetical protein
LLEFEDIKLLLVLIDTLTFSVKEAVLIGWDVSVRPAEVINGS